MYDTHVYGTLLFFTIDFLEKEKKALAEFPKVGYNGRENSLFETFHGETVNLFVGITCSWMGI